jgi:hypothetical protein
LQTSPRTGAFAGETKEGVGANAESGMMLAQSHYEVSAVVISCDGCGAETNAPCTCRKVYRPLAAAAIKANPNKSDRAIAADLGISPMTVGRARKEATVPDVTVDGREGLDGKIRRMPVRREEPDDDPGDSDETVWRRGLTYRATNAIGEAKHENWSQYKVDRKLVALARQAAEAWTETAKYLEDLLDD